jgi:1,4-dihydroxy-2-naphthoate octaprenyltransferase
VASYFKSLLGISRGPFLVLPVTLVAAGAAAAAYGLEGAFSWSRTLLSLAGMLAAHVAVNALNEAGDMRTGIDLNTRRTPFSGGSGTLPSGALSVRTAYAFGFAALAVAIAVGVFFVWRVGQVLLPLILFGAFSIVAYTPVLARAGLGEVFAGMCLGGLPILGTCLVQDGRLADQALAAAVPATLMTFNLLLLNEFPDVEADRVGGRRNLVLLLGRTGAARVYVLAAVATPASIIAAVSMGALPALALPAALPTLLLVPAIRFALAAPEGPVPTPALGGNVAWNLATNSLLAAGLLLAMW